MSEAGDEDYDDDDESSDFHVWMRTLQESLLPLGFLVICYFCMFKQAIKSEVYQALRNIVSVEKLQSNFQEVTNKQYIQQYKSARKIFVVVSFIRFCRMFKKSRSWSCMLAAST